MKNLIVNDFKAELDSTPTAQILDVRTPEECAQGIIAGALQCDLFEDHFVDRAGQLLVKEQPVFVYCRSGGRSASAAAMLEAQGYQVVNLIGGYTAWAVKGY